jgi:hypothetical protein
MALDREIVNNITDVCRQFGMNVSQKCYDPLSDKRFVVEMVVINLLLVMVYGTMSYFAGKDNGRREALKKILDGEGPLEREEILLDLCAKACTKAGWVTRFDNDEYNELGIEEVHEHWLKKKQGELEKGNLVEEKFGGEGTWRRRNLTEKELKEMTLENCGIKAENMV